MTRDCAFATQDCSFRYRAAALLERGGRVLLVSSASHGALGLPGGAVRLDEAAADAARRELLEETGLQAAPVRLIALHECFFDTPAPAPAPRAHVVELVFLMRIEGEDAPLPPGNGDETPRWVAPDALEAVRLFPPALREWLRTRPTGIQHWITRENTPLSELLGADCCFTGGPVWFRYRAAVIAPEGDAVLMAHFTPENYDYAVGGGVYLDETAEDAALREAWEETGVRFDTDRLAVINESFFDGRGTLSGRRAHVLEVYFLMKPRGTTALHPPQGEDAGAHYLPIEMLDTTEHFPLFLRDYLRERPQTALHLVSRENEPPRPCPDTPAARPQPTDEG